MGDVGTNGKRVLSTSASRCRFAHYLEPWVRERRFPGVVDARSCAALRREQGGATVAPLLRGVFRLAASTLALDRHDFLTDDSSLCIIITDIIIVMIIIIIIIVFIVAVLVVVPLGCWRSKFFDSAWFSFLPGMMCS